MSLDVSQRSIYSFPGIRAVLRGSLLDRSLIATARYFDIKTASCLSASSNFLLHLQEYLLGYIAAYRSEGITSNELQTLFTNTDNKFISSDLITASVQNLDLSYSVGASISFDDLTKSFTFPYLTHLCLAHPRTVAWSWPSFLTFAEGITNLTHLSMAYWPLPKVDTAASDDALHFLRRLSQILTRLQYLDLEGSNIELIAPVYGVDHGPDWIGGWMHVHSLNLSQGPMPLGVQIEGGPETEAWIRGEVLARQVEESIEYVRKMYGISDTRTLHVEHGWSPNNFMIKFLIDKAYARCQPVIDSNVARRPSVEPNYPV